MKYRILSISFILVGLIAVQLAVHGPLESMAAVLWLLAFTCFVTTAIVSAINMKKRALRDAQSKQT